MWNEARGLEILFVLRIASKFGKRWSRTTSHIWEHVACVLSRFELDLAAVGNGVSSTQQDNAFYLHPLRPHNVVLVQCQPRFHAFMLGRCSFISC